MSYYVGKKGAGPEGTVEWLSVTVFLEDGYWAGHVNIVWKSGGDEGFGDPVDVVWRERGRSAWEALSNTIMRLEREGRESKPENPVEMTYWGDDDPPVKLLWPRFKTLPDEEKA